MAARDSQRSKVYKSENKAFWEEKPEMLSIEACQKFTDKVWADSTLAKLPNVTKAFTPPTVQAGRCGGMSYGGRITLGTWGRQRWLILHELTHELTPDRYASHGPEFVTTYLNLVERHLGFDARQKLGAEFRKNNVVTRASLAPCKRDAKPKPKTVTRTELLTQRAVAMGCKVEKYGVGEWDVSYPPREDKWALCATYCLSLDEVERALDNFERTG